MVKKSFENLLIFKLFLLTHTSLNLNWQVTTITLHITSLTTYLFYNKCLAWIFSSELCYIPNLDISNILLWIRQVDKIRWLHEITTVVYVMNPTNRLFTGKCKYFKWVFLTKRRRNTKKNIGAVRKYVTRQINWIHQIQLLGMTSKNRTSCDKNM